MDYGASVGRAIQPRSVPPSYLKEVAKRVGEVVARGDFERARELIDEAVRVGGCIGRKPLSLGEPYPPPGVLPKAHPGR